MMNICNVCQVGDFGWIYSLFILNESALLLSSVWNLAKTSVSKSSTLGICQRNVMFSPVSQWRGTEGSRKPQSHVSVAFLFRKTGYSEKKNKHSIGSFPLNCFRLSSSLYCHQGPAWWGGGVTLPVQGSVFCLGRTFLYPKACQCWAKLNKTWGGSCSHLFCLNKNYTFISWAQFWF